MAGTETDQLGINTRRLKALADANRVKIVKLLQHRTMCVCELQGALGLAHPTVSKHLKILEEAGLVVSSKDGLWVNYTVRRTTAVAPMWPACRETCGTGARTIPTSAVRWISCPL
jgi:DNA-binding transcriptional ArsR family regulator